MSASPSEPRLPWWQRRWPSAMVFFVVIAVMAIAAVSLWGDVGDVLPSVGKDKQGEDPWNDPVGIEKVAGFQVVRIPDCAAAPIVRIGLWDEESTPYWEVSGPPTPMASFAIGATPEGWVENKAYSAPPAGAVLRLVVFRKVKGVAGARYQESDLRSGYVVSGPPINRYEVQDFQTGDVCGDDGKAGDGSTTTTEFGVTTTAPTGG